VLDEADSLLDDSFNELTLRILRKLKVSYSVESYAQYQYFKCLTGVFLVGGQWFEFVIRLGDMTDIWHVENLCILSVEGSVLVQVEKQNEFTAD